MCNDCFQTEFSSFPSESGWLEFDLELTKKLGANKIQPTSLDSDVEPLEGKAPHIYLCLSCGQKWGLRDPDYADRGFFLKYNSVGG
jgi:hypothetical protein